MILRNSNGGAQPNISETDIMRIFIPIPPLTVQNEIAAHITALRSEAAALREQAAANMAAAKADIEKMLLGGGAEND